MISSLAKSASNLAGIILIYSDYLVGKVCGLRMFASFWAFKHYDHYEPVEYMCVQYMHIHLHAYSHIHAHIQHTAYIYKNWLFDVKRSQTLGTFYKVQERFGRHVLGCI